MQVLPRISIHAGRVVFPVSDGYEETDLDPVPVIQKCAKEYETVILEDISAVLGGMPHLDLLRKVEKLNIWVDGGVRSSENVMDVLVAGGAKALLCTRTLQGLEELDSAVKLTDNIVFQIDYCQRIMGRVASQLPSVPGAIERARTAGVDAVIFMDNCSESPLEEARRLIPEDVIESLYVGILSAGQVEEASAYGMKGVVVDALELIEELTSDE